MSNSGQGREVSMATPWSWSTPVGSCQGAPLHWKQIGGKILTWPLYVPKRFETSEGKGGLEAWIRKESLKHRHSDLLRSAQQKAKCHASIGEARSPCNYSISCHERFRGNPVTPVRHKPATSNGSVLTFSKLQLPVTPWNYSQAILASF